MSPALKSFLTTTEINSELLVNPKKRRTMAASSIIGKLFSYCIFLKNWISDLAAATLAMGTR